MGLVVMVKPIFPDSLGNNFDNTSALRFVHDSLRLAMGIESSLLLLSSASDSTISFLNFLAVLSSSSELQKKKQNFERK